MGTELMGPAQLLQAQLAHSLATADVALDGLTQEEFDWEPVPGAWSVRPRSDGRRGWGAGEIVCEDAWPPPDPLPLTTIGWRVVHLAAWTRIYTDHLFGDGTASLDNV